MSDKSFDPHKVERYMPLTCCCGSLAHCGMDGVCDGGEDYPDSSAVVVVAVDYDRLLTISDALYAALEAICAERDAMLADQGEDEDITGEEGRHFLKKSWQKWDQARAALLRALPEGGQK